MKINAKSIVTLKRCLAAKQLQAYAKLCETMADFNDLVEIEDKTIKFNQNWNSYFKQQSSDSKSTSTKHNTQNRVNMLLKKYLPLASTGDLSFLVEPEFQQEVDSIFGQRNDGKDIFDYISRSFEDYADSAVTLHQFQDAEQLLSKAMRQDRAGNLVVSKKYLEQYQNYMRRNGDPLKSFDDYTRLHTRTTVGHTYYRTYLKAFRKICETNPEVANSPAFSKVTPEMFDATIRGVYKPKEHLQDISDLEQISDQYNLGSQILDAVYNKKQRLVDYSKTHTRQIMAGVLIGATLLGGTSIPAYQSVQEYNSINIYNAVEKGYSLGISDETLQQLVDSRELLDSLRNSSELPETQKLLELRDMLDQNYDNIFSDLVTPAFEKAYPGCNVTEVETSYYISSGSSVPPERTVSIEYTDEEGNTQTEVARNLSGKNPIASIFQTLSNEYATADGSFEAEMNLDDYFYDLLRKTQDTSLSFEERAQVYDVLLDFCDRILKAEEIAGSKQANFDKGFLFFDSGVTFENPEPVHNVSDGKSSKDSPTVSQAPEISEQEKDDDAR